MKATMDDLINKAKLATNEFESHIENSKRCARSSALEGALAQDQAREKHLGHAREMNERAMAQEQALEAIRRIFGSLLD